jgi:hypothetical protein
VGERYDHLTLDERKLIFQLREAKMSVPGIAERLGRHRSTIHREIRRNWHDDGPWLRGYSPRPPKRARTGIVFAGASCIRIRIWRATAPARRPVPCPVALSLEPRSRASSQVSRLSRARPNTRGWRGRSGKAEPSSARLASVLMHVNTSH